MAANGNAYNEFDDEGSVGGYGSSYGNDLAGSSAYDDDLIMNSGGANGGAGATMGLDDGVANAEGSMSNSLVNNGMGASDDKPRILLMGPEA